MRSRERYVRQGEENPDVARARLLLALGKYIQVKLSDSAAALFIKEFSHLLCRKAITYLKELGLDKELVHSRCRHFDIAGVNKMND